MISLNPRIFTYILTLTLGLHSTLVFSQVQYHSLKPPVMMPDGSEFKSWENTTAYSKTYHVDQHHPHESTKRLDPVKRAPESNDLPTLQQLSHTRRLLP